MAVNKKKMLLAMIGGVVAGVAVTFITAVGSLSENLILQEISSFVMDMMLPFIIMIQRRKPRPFARTSEG